MTRLVIYNPPHGRVRRSRGLRAGRMQLLSDRVYGVQYRHIEDGEDYDHEFAPGVNLVTTPGGEVRLYRPDGLPLWADFD